MEGDTSYSQLVIGEGAVQEEFGKTEVKYRETTTRKTGEQHFLENTKCSLKSPDNS
jgi:hypothetical protein